MSGRMDLQRLLLLFLLWSQSEAEVINSVADCAQFFLNNKPPQITGILENGVIKDPVRYKIICQTYANQRRFFTLYDITNKIPVFSSFVFRRSEKDDTQRKAGWMTEPQLETNMAQQSDRTRKNQASDDDYKNKLNYGRGHLYPSSYGLTQEDTDSTFTLTNIVPQADTFNMGSWNKMETCTYCVMKKYCIGKDDKVEAYLVAGAEPGKPEKPLLNEKINIPDIMWSAFCCYSKSEKKWLAGAHWSENVPDNPSDKYLETKTLAQLYSQLGNKVNLFPDGNCPSDATFTQCYPELNTDDYCKCPKNPSTP